MKQTTLFKSVCLGIVSTALLLPLAPQALAVCYDPDAPGPYHECDRGDRELPDDSGPSTTPPSGGTTSGGSTSSGGGATSGGSTADGSTSGGTTSGDPSSGGSTTPPTATTTSASVNQTNGVSTSSVTPGEQGGSISGARSVASDDDATLNLYRQHATQDSPSSSVRKNERWKTLDGAATGSH